MVETKTQLFCFIILEANKLLLSGKIVRHFFHCYCFKMARRKKEEKSFSNFILATDPKTMFVTQKLYSPAYFSSSCTVVGGNIEAFRSTSKRSQKEKNNVRSLFLCLYEIAFKSRLNKAGNWAIISFSSSFFCSRKILFFFFFFPCTLQRNITASSLLRQRETISELG